MTPNGIHFRVIYNSHILLLQHTHPPTEIMRQDEFFSFLVSGMTTLIYETYTNKPCVRWSYDQRLHGHGTTGCLHYNLLSWSANCWMGSYSKLFVPPTQRWELYSNPSHSNPVFISKIFPSVFMLFYPIPMGTFLRQPNWLGRKFA